MTQFTPIPLALTSGVGGWRLAYIAGSHFDPIRGDNDAPLEFATWEGAGEAYRAACLASDRLSEICRGETA